MSNSDSRQGLINHGTFFSPYYLYDLLGRQHADELDPEGREINRRLLRRPFRTVWNRCAESGSSADEAWHAWYRELFTALGFINPSAIPSQAQALRRLPTPVETARHGVVPVSHAVYALAPDTDTHHVTAEQPLILLDLHGFGIDLDRARYPNADMATPDGPITGEPVARAIEFALDANDTRWAIVAAGDRLRLYRKGGSVARQYLEVDFPALFDADRKDEWTAFWGLLRYAAFVPDPVTGKCLLDRVLEESQRHASRIADDLRENIVRAVEVLIQGILDEPANHTLIQPGDDTTIEQLFEETLYFLYRLLFILYAESRDLLPVSESLVYRDTYSLEHLRDLADLPLPVEDAGKTYYGDSLRTLFTMLRLGCPQPGLAANPGFTIPPFNGRLFDSQRTALLDRCRIPDRALRDVIRELSLSRPRRRSERRERYSYADLGVDQLGSIYEGLLVYEPTIVGEETVIARVKGEDRLVSLTHALEYRLELVPGLDGELQQLRPGAFVLRLWGGRRKGTGSYYTLQEITAWLVHQALEPMVESIVAGCGRRDRRGRPQRQPEEILEIKLCDPAMGSGAFLIQACRYLGDAFGRARIAAGLDDDSRISQAEFARYKRRVAEKCLYGVDINPLAVELAKVSLWLETLASDRPLTFLDAHLRCGNSLVGAPLRDAEGNLAVAQLSVVPDAALTEVSREATPAHKAAARARSQRNKAETRRLQPAKAGQLPLAPDWGVLSVREIETALADTLTHRLDLEASDEDLPTAEAVALVHHKEKILEQLQHDEKSRYRRATAVCDLWCASWFWPQPGSELLVEIDGRKQVISVPEPPTTQIYLELVGALLGTDPGSLEATERAVYLAVARQVAAAQRFFHWELEFPEVWRDRGGRHRTQGGFDAITGNPPWETVKPNSQEFWSNYNPLFRELGKQDALHFAADLRRDPTIDATWTRYDRNLAQTSSFLKASGHYTHQGKGDINTYKLFLEQSVHLLRVGGGLGLVLPSGLYTDLGSKELRELLFDTCQVQRLLAFVNERFIFPAVDHRFRFVLLCARRGGSTDTLRVLFRLNIQNAVAPSELAGVLANLDEVSLALGVEDIRRFSPESLSLMEFKNQREVDIAARIYDGHPLLGDEVPGSWNVRFTRELDMTNDSHLFRGRAWLLDHGCQEQGDQTWLGPGGERYLPLYEGKMRWYEDWMADPNYWVEEGQGRARVLRSAPAIVDYEQDRFGYRRIAASTNERTLVLGWVPRGRFAAYTLTTTTVNPLGGGPPYALSPSELLFLSSCLRSFSLDFLIRQQVMTSVAIFNGEGLPVPRRTSGDPGLDALVLRMVQLLCTSAEYAQLWNTTAKYYPDRIAVPWRSDYVVTKPKDRAQLRAEIDALVADLYGLPVEDFAYILTTFPLLDRNQPALPGEPKSFITRDLALLELFKLRGTVPPADIVPFFAAAGADITAVTGPLRDLAERVAQALALGAVAYVPGGRGGGVDIGVDIMEDDATRDG